MRFAAIETSTEWCSLALWLDGDIAALEQRAGQRHGEVALPLLERLLGRAKLAVSQLDAVAFGAGPGSFTGLRIACGIAQGLAYARGIPVIGIPTLEAIAEESGAARVIACLDARMHEVYYSALAKDPGQAEWREAIPAQCVAPAMVPKPAGGGWLGCGDGFAVYAGVLAQALDGALSHVAPQIRPNAVAIAKLAAPRLAAGQGVDASLAVPAYVRDKVALTTQERNRR
jgi:tRNA threonylcarbamoyladenosine biosynthesis protein TsaB